VDHDAGRFRNGVIGPGETVVSPRATRRIASGPAPSLFNLALITLAIVTGCGNIQSVEADPPQPTPPPPIGVVGGEAGITRVTDAAGNARYLGEVENLGDEVACNIRVTVNSYDSSDNLLTNPANQNSGFADLLGETFRFSAFTSAIQETCLSPGKRAPFDIRNDFLLSQVMRIESSTTCDGALYEGCLDKGQPFAPPVATLAVDGAVSEGVTGDGRVVYSGTIRNQSPSDFAPTYHVKIVFTARNAAGLVVDVACSTIDGAECPVPQGSPSANTGLGPGDTWSFSVPLSVEPSDTCSGCFSYIINQKPTL
jgi:hypothetical protein